MVQRDPINQSKTAALTFTKVIQVEMKFKFLFKTKKNL